MTSIVINGNAYSDDGSTPQDMQHYGYLTHLLPMIGDTATVAGQVAADAAQVALDAIAASDAAAALQGTSATSLTVAAGAQTMTTQTGKQFTAGNYVTVSRTSAPTTLMHGVVTSYSGTTLVIEVANIAGSGTFTDWTIALSGASGAQGPSGNGVMPYAAKTGAYTVVATDRGSLIDCTSGTFTLSFQPCATLGADWAVYIRNSGAGAVTLDPSGGETINGAATFSLPPGTVLLLVCDGAVLRIGFSTITQLTKLKIFESAAATITGASSMEILENASYATGLTTDSQIYRALYVGGLFVAQSAGDVGYVSTSPDGITWTLRTMPSTGYWSISTDGTNFIAVKNNVASPVVAVSTDGITWTSGTSMPGNPDSLYGNVKFVGTTGLIMGTVSTTTAYKTINNGASWTTVTLPVARGNAALVSIGGLFLYWTSGTTYYTSATGETGSWTARTLPFINGLGYSSIDFDGNLIATSGVVLAAIYRTTDGINWTDTGFLYGSYAAKINGIVTSFGSGYAAAFSWHNGKKVLRASSGGYAGLYFNYEIAKSPSGVHIIPAPAGRVLLIDPAAADAATALFME